MGSGVETTQTLTGRHPPGAGWNRCSQPHISHATPEDMVGTQPTLGESVFPSCLTANKGKRGSSQAAALGIGHSGRERERESLQRVWDVCSRAGLAPSSDKGITFAEDHLWLAQHQPPRPGTARHSNRQNLQRRGGRMFSSILPAGGTARKSGMSNDLDLLLHP